MGMGTEPGADERLWELFERWLEARDGGADRCAEVLAEAGPLAERLEGLIQSSQALRTLAAPQTAPAPERVGRFTILALIGRGGLGKVWRAFDPALKREVAIKLLSGPTFEVRSAPWLLNEARVLARIRHEGVVQVLDVGQDGETPYIAMELLPGPTLRDLIDELRRRRDGRPAPDPSPAGERLAAAAERFASLEDRIECLARLAEALAHCHDRGVLHRDVKANNVLLDADLRPRLIDFGLAHDPEADEDSRVILTQRLVGAPGSLAPEQVEGARIGASPASDQFSLGTLAYEWLALEHPFERATRSTTMDAVARCQPRPLRRVAPAIPQGLSAVVHGALQHAPEERYPDLVEFAADLRRVLRHEAPLRSAPSLAQVLHLWLRRNRRLVLQVATAVAVTIGLSAAWWYHRAEDQHARLRASLAEVEPGSLGTPAALLRRCQTLLSLGGQVRDHDASGQALLFGALGPALDAQSHAWSRRLHEVTRQALAEAERRGVSFQYPAFQELFLMDEQLCPDCPYNETDRHRGEIRFPPELERYERTLYQLCNWEGEGPPWVYRPTDLRDTLAPGMYRLQAWVRGGPRLASETEFFVPDLWNPALELPLSAPAPAYYEGSLRLESSRYRMPQGTLPLPAYRLWPRLVTVAEVRRFVAETGTRLASPDSLSDRAGDVAAVSLEEARAFCRWIGGRLPSLYEMLHARDEGRISWAVTAEVGGEFLTHGSGTLLVPDYSAWLNYAHPPGTPIERLAAIRTSYAAPIRYSLPSEDGGQTTRIVGFRVAFSDDMPARYAEAAAAPFVPNEARPER